jgi:hypothetical protein
MQCEMGAKKHYGMGRYFKGMLTKEAYGLSISTTQGYGADMSHLQEQTNISLIITEKLTKEDDFKLYIVKRYDAADYY